MIIRNAEKTELPFIREQRIISYKEHAEHIPKGHWKALKKSITSEADTQSEIEMVEFLLGKSGFLYYTY